MTTIDTLPCTAKDVGTLKFEDMVDTVKSLSHPDTNIAGQAAMEVNAFLAHAAIRMANALTNSSLAMKRATEADLDTAGDSAII